MIKIILIQTKKELKQFIDFPHALYTDDSCYVPELYFAQKELLNKKNNPFFNHSDAEFFLAIRNKKVVGRIAAIKNNNYIKYTGIKAGKFGFFDVIEDFEVAKILLDEVVKWIKNWGLDTMTGPENYSTNDTCGTLIDGFDRPPTIMMTYNKPYYQKFLEKYGLQKDMDLFSYIIYTKDIPEKLLRLSSSILKRLNSRGVTIRKANLSQFDKEVKNIFKIYNSAWEKNWGFVPMLEDEFKHAAKDLKQILDPDFLLIAEFEGEPIGYSLSIPDMNIPLKTLKKGRLLPFGIFKLLYNKRRINCVRVITLGVIEKYRKLGIDAYFYMKAFEEAKNKNMLYGEASWILENNIMMNKALININGSVYKTHRLFKKSI